MKRTALITGASSGIGRSFAGLLAAEGLDLLLVARRTERLHALAAELREAYGLRIEVFAANLTHPGTPAAIVAFAAEQGLGIDVVVNDAGMAASSSFADSTWSALAGELQLMATAVVELVHRVGPGMKARGWGRIINLSSLAAFSPPGESLLYTGINSYVLNMSQSLDMELKPHGIHVTALCPGFTHSEFHDVMGTHEAASKLPSILWQEPEDVVREGWTAVNKGKPICIPGRVNKVLVNVTRPIPYRTQYVLGRTFNPFACDFQMPPALRDTDRGDRHSLRWTTAPAGVRSRIRCVPAAPHEASKTAFPQVSGRRFALLRHLISRRWSSSPSR